MINYVFLKDRNDQSWAVIDRIPEVGETIDVNGFSCTVVSNCDDDVIVESTEEAMSSYDKWLDTWRL